MGKEIFVDLKESRQNSAKAIILLAFDLDFINCHAMEMSVSLSNFITKFPYNARSDWLKQRALSENRARVDDGKLASKFLLRNFDEFDPN